MSSPDLSLRISLIALAFGATFTLTSAASAPPPPVAPELSLIPMALGPWSGEAADDLAPDVAAVLAADQYVHRYYHGPGGTIEMDVSYYAQPRVGANMHSPLNCLPGNGWTVTRTATLPVDADSGIIGVRELTVERGPTKYLLAYWYQSRNRIVTDEISSRFYLLADAMRRQPTDTGLVRLLLPASGGAQESSALGAFASRLIPEIASRFD